MKKQTVRTRFAPSPTGFLHIGGLRTALYNYLFAKKNQGQFILRIEDTDRERYQPEAMSTIIDTLKKFGINYDEGPDLSGPYGPYIQSERLEIYRKKIAELIANNRAYYCFCSSERLEKIRTSQSKKSLPTKYDKHCLQLKSSEINANLKNNLPYVVRLKVDPGETQFTDLIRGVIKVNNETIDDQILLKSDGYPTYHLANVVDDYLMKITHVIRGEEWVPSTPKHVLLYQAFNWDMPIFAHLPLLLNKDKSKLSKRQGDVAANDYLNKGYLPEAIINFIALLGWNPGNDKEFFSLDELIQNFDLKKVQKSGAIFNLDKLNWFNSHYIANKPTKDLLKNVKTILSKKDFYKPDLFSLEQIIDLFKSRVNNLEDLANKTHFLFKLPDYSAELLVNKKNEPKKIKEILNYFLNIILNYQKSWTAEELKIYFDQKRESANYTRAESFWPLRVAITGLENSPDVFAVMALLGKEETIMRINIAIEKINQI